MKTILMFILTFTHRLGGDVEVNTSTVQRETNEYVTMEMEAQ